MIAINVSTNADRLLQQTALDAREMRTAVMRSIDRAAAGVVTDAIREITKKYNVTGKTLRGNDRRLGAFSIKRPTPADLSARVTASGHPLPLVGFKHKQTTSGVEISIKKSVTKTIRHAFVARMKSGHVGVFRRNPKKTMAARGPKATKHSQGIDEKYTSSVPGMIRSLVKDINNAIKRGVDERFDKTMAQQVRYFSRSR